MKKNYQAIILVLASDDDCIKNTRWLTTRMKPEWQPLFPYFKNIWLQYMNVNPNVKVLFVYGNSQVDNPQDHDLIYLDVVDNNWPGMITKTLYAMKDIEEQYDYDFLIRTNLSTFWDLNKLSTRLSTLPKTRCLAGTEIKNHDTEGNQNHYIAGFDMVMSRDLIQGILPYTEDIISKKVFSSMEDLALCTAFKDYCNMNIITYGQEHAATILGMTEFSESIYQSALDLQKSRNMDHFRVKSRLDRNIDKLLHQKLLNDIYGKTAI